MNWRTVGILFIVVVLLGAVVYLMSQEDGSETGVDPDATEIPTAIPQENLVRDVAIADVQRLEVTRLEDDFQVAFIQDDNSGWFQVVPTETTVISATMNSEVTRLINMTSQSVLSADANPLSVYGLDDPQYEIVLVARRDDNNVRFTFTVGNQTPTGDRYYAQKQGDPRVHVLLSSTVDSITGLLDERPIPTPTPETADSG